MEIMIGYNCKHYQGRLQVRVRDLPFPLTRCPVRKIASVHSDQKLNETNTRLIDKCKQQYIFKT